MSDDRERKLQQAQEIQRRLAGPGLGKQHVRHARLVRTIGLGSVAVVFAIYWVAREYGADTEELLGFLGLSVLFVGLFAGLALVAGFLLWIVKRIVRKTRS